MKEKYEEYLKDIGCPSEIFDIVENILSDYNKLLDFDFNDIFIEEHINEDSGREYESLFLFNDEYLIEANNFIHQENYILAYMKNRFTSIRFNKKEFDLKNTNSKSRFNIEAISLEGAHLNLKSSRKNCLYLYEIYKKYLINNFIE